MEKTLLVTCHAPEAVRAAIEEGLAGAARILFLEDAEPESRGAVLSSASALLSFFFNREVKEEEYPLLEETEIFQSISTGLDFLPFERMPKKMILACNAGGWAPQIA
ncbi:MAG: hypothetical protein PHI81_04850 [Synergistaceae bacterium]|nr:hypothetical protein [Synergistaceae bacterium]